MADQETAVTVIDACGRARVPSLLLSDPGMGKSSVIRALAKADGVACETVLGSIREPADFAGLPVVTDEGVKLDAPAWARRLREAGDGYLFLDELTTCPQSVQAAMLAVALDRKVGDLTLPFEVKMVAGANPPDRAADGYELSPPLANRFCHIDYASTPDEWLDGMTTNWATLPASRAVAADKLRRASRAAAVRGFIHVRPELLDNFPESAAETGGAWPSRRTWTNLAAVLAHVRDDDHAVTQAVTFGLVGEGAGAEFLEWWAKSDLPDPEAVIADPSVVDWHDRPDRVWAVLSAVTGWAATRSTKEAWRDAWGPLVACVDAGVPDVAAAAARTHARTRPPKTPLPSAVRRFQPLLVAAGLADEAATATQDAA